MVGTPGRAILMNQARVLANYLLKLEKAGVLRSCNNLPVVTA